MSTVRFCAGILSRYKTCYKLEKCDAVVELFEFYVDVLKAGEKYAVDVLIEFVDGMSTCVKRNRVSECNFGIVVDMIKTFENVELVDVLERDSFVDFVHCGLNMFYELTFSYCGVANAEEFVDAGIKVPMKVAVLNFEKIILHIKEKTFAGEDYNFKEYSKAVPILLKCCGICASIKRSKVFEKMKNDFQFVFSVDNEDLVESLKGFILMIYFDSDEKEEEAINYLCSFIKEMSNVFETFPFQTDELIELSARILFKIINKSKEKEIIIGKVFSVICFEDQDEDEVVYEGRMKIGILTLLFCYLLEFNKDRKGNESYVSFLNRLLCLNDNFIQTIFSKRLKLFFNNLSEDSMKILFEHLMKNVVKTKEAEFCTTNKCLIELINERNILKNVKYEIGKSFIQRFLQILHETRMNADFKFEYVSSLISIFSEFINTFNKFIKEEIKEEKIIKEYSEMFTEIWMNCVWLGILNEGHLNDFDEDAFSSMTENSPNINIEHLSLLNISSHPILSIDSLLKVSNEEKRSALICTCLSVHFQNKLKQCDFDCLFEYKTFRMRDSLIHEKIAIVLNKELDLYLEKASSLGIKKAQRFAISLISNSCSHFVEDCTFFVDKFVNLIELNKGLSTNYELMNFIKHFILEIYETCRREEIQDVYVKFKNENIKINLSVRIDKRKKALETFMMAMHDFPMNQLLDETLKTSRIEVKYDRPLVIGMKQLGIELTFSNMENVLRECIKNHNLFEFVNYFVCHKLELLPTLVRRLFKILLIKGKEKTNKNERKEKELNFDYSIHFNPIERDEIKLGFDVKDLLKALNLLTRFIYTIEQFIYVTEMTLNLLCEINSPLSVSNAFKLLSHLSIKIFHLLLISDAFFAANMISSLLEGFSTLANNCLEMPFDPNLNAVDLLNEIDQFKESITSRLTDTNSTNPSKIRNTLYERSFDCGEVLICICYTLESHFYSLYNTNLPKPLDPRDSFYTPDLLRNIFNLNQKLFVSIFTNPYFFDNKDVITFITSKANAFVDYPKCMQFVLNSYKKMNEEALCHRIPIPSAITVLEHKFSQKAILQNFCFRVLHSHSPHDNLFFIPQIVQALRLDGCGAVEEFILRTAFVSPQFAHQIIWNIKANMYPNELAPVFERIIKQIIDRFNPPDLEFYKREFDFFDKITSISGTLRPFVKKSKTEKKKKIDEELAKISVDPGVYLPSNPESTVIDIDYLSGRPLQSHAKAPFMATFHVKNNDGSEQWQSAIFKVGDDCRQDVLALQLVAIFRTIYSDLNLPLYLFPYRVVATGAGMGIIEVIPNSMSRDQMGREKLNDLYEFFILKFGKEHSNGFHKAKIAFIQSIAAYSIICYLLAIKDRHNGNIMIDEKGHIVHIGGINFESAPFKLTSEMLAIIDSDPNDYYYKLYETMCIQAFYVARKHYAMIVDSVSLMRNSGLPCFKGSEIVNLFLDQTVRKLENRFALHLHDTKVVQYVKNLILNSYESKRSKLYDSFQKQTNGIPYK
ncbi:hypothetical protein ROZALSC1DRAFT_26895 [Rozella allomycis CSF55]|uniref:1-phosphatidylinositol 4-kinase n=1 Tax=Rozella allomycis (strain CSF55) TaxID=988480 RepID=A0A4P9YQ80_ROZAC|nr:hypothetical protein ROZALSC1DRAFT_26895 [Rozella allomycis CSF55]